jgi:hypothetical protein
MTDTRYPRVKVHSRINTDEDFKRMSSADSCQPNKKAGCRD